MLKAATAVRYARPNAVICAGVDLGFFKKPIDGDALLDLLDRTAWTCTSMMGDGGWRQGDARGACSSRPKARESVDACTVW